MTLLNFIPASITVASVANADLSFSIGVQNADGTPFDLTGYTITAPISSPDSIAPPVPDFTATNPDAGIITLALTAAETGELGAVPYRSGTWEWSVWIQSADRRQLVRGVLVLA